MQSFDRADQLGGALQSTLGELTFPVTPTVQDNIRRQVCDYADELKALGLPPERIIIAVKLTANNVGMRPSRYAGTAASLDATDKLLVDMVRWCIERYYERRQARIG